MVNLCLATTHKNLCLTTTHKERSTHKSVKKKKSLYFRVFKILYMKFQSVFLQQKFKFNLKIICNLPYDLCICHN